MGLRDYHRKRDFERTPEPRGREANAATPGARFVVQKHDARRLHYDFRLELGGVLKSWAVPKGPSLNPGERRLAVHVEDHPLEYGEFEGVIPKGEYGGGTVLVWDQGTWTPEGDAEASYRKGHLRFRLNGRKLRGDWHLVRTRPRSEDNAKDHWLLMKRDDEYRSTHEPVDEAPDSVLSGRSLEEISERGDRVWHTSQGRKSGPTASPRRVRPELPDTLKPQLATLVDRPPTDDRWLHEIKYDGYRILARIEGNHIRLFSRNGKDWSNRFPSLCTALRDLNLGYAWIDGEVAHLLPDGRSGFGELQLALSKEDDRSLVYLLFDLLFHAGRDIRGQPLIERKALLQRLLDAGGHSPKLRFSDHLRGHGQEFYDQACKVGLEGIISKLADRPYRSGRSRDWQKIKCIRRQEFVIIGYTDPAGSRRGFGALLLGIHEQEGVLRYAGRVGTGFDERTLRDLHGRLQTLHSRRAPVPREQLPPEALRGAHWVRPELVAEVAFADWTRDGVLRHPSFQGLREDKPPREVRREAAQPPSAPGAEAKPKGDVYAGVRLSNPDKVLYPGQDLSKRDLAEYYTGVAERLLADIANRPLTLLRCPDGRHGQCFFQKHAPSPLPAGVLEVPVEKKNKASSYMAVDGLSGLMALVQLGVLEIHVWGARRDRLERPDRLVFDLDPDEGLGEPAVVEAALRIRARLEDLGMAAFVKTTGGKGLHVVSPIVRRHSWEQAKAFSRALAADMVRSFAGEYTSSPSKSARRGKLFIDYLRNGRGATAIANYSTRAREGATIAFPIQWAELQTRSIPRCAVLDIGARLASHPADPWEGFSDAARAITKRAQRDLGMK